jgi:hypothetical protein
MSDMPGLGNPLGDEPSAELSLSEQSIVSRTEDAEIVGRLAAPARPRFFVVELSELACSAALSVAAHERAAQPIPRRDDAHDRLTSARGVSRVRHVHGAFQRRVARLRGRDRAACATPKALTRLDAQRDHQPLLDQVNFSSSV